MKWKFSSLGGMTLALSPILVRAQAYLDEASSAELPDASIYDILGSAMNYLLAILGFLAIIGFVISGILYLTAAGDEKRMGTAKNAMFYSIMGVIVALVGYVIVSAVDSWLRAGSNTSI